nr:PREDICTED: piggyBac transposable element-derived protein 4-like [Megachile rotundata]
MDEAELVRILDQLDPPLSDDEEIVAPSSRHPCRIYSDSEASDTEPDLEKALNNFCEVTVANDSQHNPHPQFMEIAGPKHMPPRNSTLRQYFDLFFTEEFLNSLRTETNQYARQKWALHADQHFLVIGQQIIGTFHDNNKLAAHDSPEYDPKAKFGPVVTHANNKFKYHYLPHQHLSIDESLVDTKCRTSLTQYLPNKRHHKWGIKFWMLSDTTNHYCLSFFCYRGATNPTNKDEIRTNGLGYVAVHKLLNMGNYFMKGFHVAVDNYFISMLLARSLFEKQTYLTGTIRSNRKYYVGIRVEE